MKSHLLFFLLLLSHSVLAKLTTDSLYFRNLRMKDGLPGSSINTIIQDSLDFIWIGTNDGLCRYDGENFKIFKSVPSDIHSLSDNNIQNLHLDSKGNLYILTAYGLDYFNLKHQIISRLGSQFEGELADASPTDIVETSTGDLYISSYYSGISYKKKADNSFRYLHSNLEKKSALSSDRISQLALYEDSLLVIGYWDSGIDIYNLKSNHNQPLGIYSDGKTIPINVNTLVLDKNSGIWIGSKDGLSYLNLETKRVDNYIHNKTKQNFLPDNDVISLYIDNDENLWIGTRDGGLSIVNSNELLKKGVNAKYSNYTSNYNQGSLSYRTVLSIFKDRSNDMWIGTHGGGLNYVENQKNRFSLLQHQPGIQNSLSYNKVWGITEDQRGNIWLGTDGDGVNVWSKTKGIIKHFVKDENKASSISDDAIISAFTDHLGTVWLGTYEGGINRFIPESQSFKSYSVQNALLPANDVRCIYEDDENTLWIGLNQGGVCYYKRDEDRFIPHPLFNNEDVRSVCKINNQLWVGTYGDGLISLNLINKKIKRYNSNDSDSSTICPPIIFSLFSDSNNTLWLGSANAGLYKLNIKEETFEMYQTADGLSNNKVHKILGNKSNELWLSTNSGISKFDIIKQTFVNYDWHQGVQSEEFHNGSGIITTDGLFVFGGIKGVNIFNPLDFKSKTAKSKVRFTGLKVLNQPVSANKEGVIETSIEFNPEIHLNYRHSIFTIDFQSIQYPSSADITYQYLLDGYDKEWSNAGPEKSVTYRNLPPGEYIFRVRIAGKAEDMGNEAKLNIYMTPPYWKTKIAFLIYFLLLSAIIIGIFRYRVAQYKIRNRLKYEQKLRLKEGKLHDERLEFFTNISHELRTPLTIINVAIDEMALLKKSYPKIKKPIDAALANSNRLLELVNKLLEFRQVEKGVSSLSVSEINLNAFLGEFLKGFREMAKHNSINLKLLVPINELTLWVDVDKFSMILNNLLSNAFKHTPAKGEVILSVDEDNTNIILKVEDSGKGIPKNIQGKIFKRYYKLENESTNTGIGLALTKSLVNLHNADINVDSTIGKGSVFTVLFLKGNKHYSPKQFSLASDKEEVNNTDASELEQIEIKNNEQVILIVDDNLEILDLLNEKLGQEYKIIKATDGQQGVELAKKYSPNLVLSDIMMPIMSGTELCNELKNNVQTSHIPIILLTAKGTTDDEIQGLNVGADDYISKPFKISLLQARIRSILENRIKIYNYFASNSETNEIVEQIEEGNSREVEFLANIEKYILQNYLSSDVSVFELASELGFSRTTLYRKIKSLTGLSINAFVRSVKIKKSAELIKQGMNVSEAAFYIGFNDLKYYRENFKKQMGKNPSEFK